MYKRQGAGGVDGIELEEFDKNWKNRLYVLWNRMSSGCYFPKPVRGVEIPKKNGKVRLLGIPTIEDRVAQMVLRNHIEPFVEPVFHEDSYGYRPGTVSYTHLDVYKRQDCETDFYGVPLGEDYRLYYADF